MKAKWAAVLTLCLAFALGPAGPAAAQKPAAGPEDIMIRVCNNTNDNARVAISYQPVGSSQFYNEGWYGVPSRSCQDLARTSNAYIYGYAEVENDGSRYWSGNHPLCVQYPGPYAFWSTGSQYCETSQEVRDFVVMHAEDFGSFTWTLNPPE
jgi:uncharacterized membrane protein